jgi:translation elongation factor EF-Tu-like GTPase
MGLWPFGSKKDDRSVDSLLAQANAASPTGPGAAAATAPSAPTGDGTFRLPVEDIFFITGRGVVVTGRVESGTVRVGMQVNVVRDGGVATTTTVTGVEMFRKVMDSATTGDNVGLLLKGLSKEQLHTGDLIQG